MTLAPISSLPFSRLLPERGSPITGFESHIVSEVVIFESRLLAITLIRVAHLGAYLNGVTRTYDSQNPRVDGAAQDILIPPQVLFPPFPHRTLHPHL